MPLVVAVLFFRSRWRQAFLLTLLGLVIDLDHLLANPVYDPQRCSIGFHPLHMPAAIVLYALLVCFPKSRLLGIGLLIHIGLDGLDCKMTNDVWFV